VTALLVVYLVGVVLGAVVGVILTVAAREVRS
jgi:hypothetical protein